MAGGSWTYTSNGTPGTDTIGPASPTDGRANPGTNPRTCVTATKTWGVSTGKVTGGGQIQGDPLFGPAARCCRCRRLSRAWQGRGAGDLRLRRPELGDPEGQPRVPGQARRRPDQGDVDHRAPDQRGSCGPEHARRVLGHGPGHPVRPGRPRKRSPSGSTTAVSPGQPTCSGSRHRRLLKRPEHAHRRKHPDPPLKAQGLRRAPSCLLPAMGWPSPAARCRGQRPSAS